MSINMFAPYTIAFPAVVVSMMLAVGYVLCVAVADRGRRPVRNATALLLACGLLAAGMHWQWFPEAWEGFHAEMDQGIVLSWRDWQEVVMVIFLVSGLGGVAGVAYVGETDVAAEKVMPIIVGAAT